jgi:geranyl diphosphate synthase
MLLLMASSLTAFVPTPGAFTVDVRPPGVHPVEERRQQQRIAEITELIHVASLLHDDVIDDAETRRGLKALNLVFGNKIAILAGVFFFNYLIFVLINVRSYLLCTCPPYSIPFPLPFLPCFIPLQD